MTWKDINGWFAFQPMYDHILSTVDDGDTIVEIGVGFGRSLAYLASKVIESKKNVTLYGVDPFIDDWKPPPYTLDEKRPTWGGEYAEWGRSVGGPFNAFSRSMGEHAPLELETVNMLRCDSLVASRMFDDGSLHAVMIDGDHSYTAVWNDISTWIYKIKYKGIICGDDYSFDFPDLMRAVHDYFGINGFEVTGTTWWVQL